MAETTTYQCPNCNGRLIFDGSIGKLRCEFCESEFTTAEVEALYAEKQAQADAKATSGIDNQDAYNRALRLASEAGIDVDRATGREGDDGAHRSRRIGLRAGDHWRGEDEGRRAGGQGHPRGRSDQAESPTPWGCE